jgi:NADH-quinone oxidoreductase subunit C
MLELIEVNLIELTGVSAVDHLERLDRAQPKDLGAVRFVCMLNKLGCSQEQGVRVRDQAGDEEPEVASLFSLDSGTEAMGREAFELLGIIFTDHPGLKRILMKVGWKGRSLCQDYGSGRVSVQFKVSPGSR